MPSRRFPKERRRERPERPAKIRHSPAARLSTLRPRARGWRLQRGGAEPGDSRFLHALVIASVYTARDAALSYGYTCLGETERRGISTVIYSPGGWNLTGLSIAWSTSSGVMRTVDLVRIEPEALTAKPMAEAAT